MELSNTFFFHRTKLKLSKSIVMLNLIYDTESKSHRHALKWLSVNIREKFCIYICIFCCYQ